MQSFKYCAATLLLAAGLQIAPATAQASNSGAGTSRPVTPASTPYAVLSTLPASTPNSVLSNSSRGVQDSALFSVSTSSPNQDGNSISAAGAAATENLTHEGSSNSSGFTSAPAPDSVTPPGSQAQETVNDGPGQLTPAHQPTNSDGSVATGTNNTTANDSNAPMNGVSSANNGGSATSARSGGSATDNSTPPDAKSASHGSASATPSEASQHHSIFGTFLGLVFLAAAAGLAYWKRVPIATWVLEETGGHSNEKPRGKKDLKTPLVDAVNRGNQFPGVVPPRPEGPFPRAEQVFPSAREQKEPRDLPRGDESQPRGPHYMPPRMSQPAPPPEGQAIPLPSGDPPPREDSDASHPGG